MKRTLRLNKTTRNNYVTYAVVILAFLVMQILSSTGGLSSTMEGMLVPICAYVVMAVSLNLTVGVLGELSLGHAGFMSVGAFTGVTAAVALGIRLLRARRRGDGPREASRGSAPLFRLAALCFFCFIQPKSTGGARPAPSRPKRASAAPPAAQSALLFKNAFSSSRFAMAAS